MSLKIGKKSHKDKKSSQRSMYGAYPFIYWAFISLFGVVLGLLMGIGSMHGLFLEQRDRFSDTQDVLGWVFTSMSIPYALLFIVVFISSIAMISQSTLRYTWWVITQSISASISYMVITLVVAAMILGIAFAVSQPGATSTDSTNEFAASQMWVAGHIVVAFVSWSAYKSAWKIYRVVGAQTMQQRYEADVAKMEIYTSGRFWDKWVERPIRVFLGKDGNKPRGGFFYIVFTTVASMAASTAVIVSGISFFMPLALISLPIFIVIFFAAVAKYSDGLYNKKTPPVLNKVRDENTEDTYNPESKGHKVFVR